ncbi:MAG: TolC family protein [Verrucomicrobiae bacterium]|nr:TolC family protein [Verrucomicrobiae bacterium]
MSRYFFWNAFFLFFIFSQNAWTQDNKIVSSSQPMKFTLAEAVTRALEKNPDLLKAKAEIQRLAGVTYEVRAAALPHLTLEGSFTQTDEYLLGRNSGRNFSSRSSSLEGQDFSSQPNFDQFTDEQWQVGIRFSKLLYDGGETRARIEQAKLGEQAGFYQLQEAILDVVFNVRQIFYTVLVNRARIAVEEQNIHLLSAELDRQKKFLEAGTVARFNVLRADVAVSNAKPQLIDAKNQYRISLRQLAKLLAIDGAESEDFHEDTLEVVGDLEVKPRKVELRPLLMSAFNKRPALQVAKLGVSSQLVAIRVARSGYYPRLEAFATYGYSHENFTDELYANDGGYTAGVQGSWNIWDGLETKGRVDQARAQWRSSVVNKEDVARGIDLEVRTAYSHFVEAAELVESQKGNVKLADEALRLAGSRFEAGAGTQLETLDAQTELNRARLNELQARYRYQVALAEIARSAGGDAFFSRMP